jgi:hypothetical protein
MVRVCGNGFNVWFVIAGGMESWGCSAGRAGLWRFFAAIWCAGEDCETVGNGWRLGGMSRCTGLKAAVLMGVDVAGSRKLAPLTRPLPVKCSGARRWDCGACGVMEVCAVASWE